jgi:hypothetical protein
MTDWKEIAAARGLKIPQDQLERMTPTLEALEKAFRPIAERLEVFPGEVEAK